MKSVQRLIAAEVPSNTASPTLPMMNGDAGTVISYLGKSSSRPPLDPEELMRLARRAALMVMRRRTNGRWRRHVDDAASSIVLYWLEFPDNAPKGKLRLDDLRLAKGIISRLTNTDLSICDMMFSADTENPEEFIYQKGKTNSTQEVSTFAKQALELTSRLPFQHRQAMLSLADGATPMEAAQEVGMTITEFMRVHKEGRNIMKALAFPPTEGQAVAIFETVMLSGLPCPHCGSDEGFVSVSATHRQRARRCLSCRLQITVSRVEPFRSSPLPLRKWLMGMYLISDDGGNHSGLSLARLLGVSDKTGVLMRRNLLQCRDQEWFDRLQAEAIACLDVERRIKLAEDTIEATPATGVGVQCSAKVGEIGNPKHQCQNEANRRWGRKFYCFEHNPGRDRLYCSRTETAQK